MAEIVPTKTDITTRMTDRELLESVHGMLAGLTAKIANMEREAQEMFSPDKMMEMAGKFLGTGF
jgi:hypothetical protein